jgi:hypothetical protein
MSQRDQYVAEELSHVGERYCAAGDCRCHGTCPGWDCSGLATGDPLQHAQPIIPLACTDTDGAAAFLQQHGRTCDRATARRTKGAWAIRTKTNPLIPGDGHIVTSLGDGTTVEAHSSRDGVIRGIFDGNRGFQVYGLPPLAGFDQPPAPNPGPTTPEEANAMNMPARIVPGSRTQQKAGNPWDNRWPFIGFVAQVDGAWDAVGFNGARITNHPDAANPKGATSAFGMSVYHLGHLVSGISEADVVDGKVVGIAGDGGTFTIGCTVDYL